MPNTKTDLGDKLKEVSGYNHVYFQPPESVKMSYPCIRYDISDVDVDRADDTAYKRKIRYTVTRIGNKSDEYIIDAFLNTFPYCRFDRRYITDNLYHDVFIIYY